MLERTILSQLVYNEAYAQKVFAFLKPDYFQNGSEQQVFKFISEHVEKYSKLPTKEVLYLELGQLRDIQQPQFEAIKGVIQTLMEDLDVPLPYLVEQTEKWVKEKALYNAMMASIKLMDKKEGVGAIPSILEEALAISFDPSVGHDFLEDWEARWEAYNTPEAKVPFDLEYMNRITKGGVSKGTLNMLMGGTGVGKTLLMCHFAAANLVRGLNVLYVTLEMPEIGEPSITQRIDANLLDITMDDLLKIPKDKYKARIDACREKCKAGKLVVKEYPSAAISVLNIEHVMNELRVKKKFQPDIIYIDYINLMTSARMKRQGVSSYDYVLSIAMEVRGFAQKHKLPVISATQVNRQGFVSSDPGLENVAESFGLTNQADLFLAITSSDELADLNQYAVKQLKNRYNDKARLPRFAIGVDRPKMRLYDVEESAQREFINQGKDDDKPVMDSSPFGDWEDVSTAKFDGFQ